MEKEFELRTGRVITITIQLERIIDKFLSEYFCYGDKQKDDFKSLILFNERITLDFKKELMTIILKKNYTQLLDKNPTILSDLSRLPEHRNRFAHLEKVKGKEMNEVIKNKIQVWSAINGDKTIADVSEDTIVFKRYKNGAVKYLGYGKYELDEMKNQLRNIADFLIEVFKNIQIKYVSEMAERNKIKIEALIEFKNELLNTDREQGANN